MKQFACLALLTLVGCAHGYDFEPETSTDSTDIPSEEPITPPSDSVAVSPPKPVQSPPDPLLILQNQGLMYSVDEAFWMAYMGTITSGTQKVEQKLGCPNGGVMLLEGSVSDTHTLVNSEDQLLVDFDLTFQDCLLPDAYITVNLIYTGKMKITGSLYGGAYENDLRLQSDEMNFTGKMVLNNGEVILINEQCQFDFSDNFRESQGLGGLSGKICGMKTEVSER